MSAGRPRDRVRRPPDHAMTVSTRPGASPATIAPSLCPHSKRGIAKKAGRRATATTTCTGGTAGSPTLPSVTKPLQYDPVRAVPRRRSLAIGNRHLPRLVSARRARRRRAGSPAPGRARPRASDHQCSSRLASRPRRRRLRPGAGSTNRTRRSSGVGIGAANLVTVPEKQESLITVRCTPAAARRSGSEARRRR